MIERRGKKYQKEESGAREKERGEKEKEERENKYCKKKKRKKYLKSSVCFSR